MTKYVLNKKFHTLLALLAATLLGGCGESTNIEAENGGMVSSCSSLLNVTCVTGRLIDDAVYNVDYECASTNGSVRSVTGIDGSFSCPSGSEVTFSLINPENDEFRIKLGSVAVRLPAQIYGENSPTPVYFYVTPRHLAGDLEGPTLAMRSINITRLLQTLSTDTIDADQSGFLPTRTIRISDDDKRKIDADTTVEYLAFSSADADTPALPSAGTFDFAAQDFLTAVGKFPLISRAQAEIALTKGVYSTMAGIYSMPGGSVLSVGALNPGSAVTTADTGAMVGYDISAGKTFLGALYALVDRRGRMIATGVYSYGVATGDSWSIWSAPKPMQLASTGTERNNLPYWPLDGDLTQLELNLLGSGDGTKKVEFTQGLMRRESIAGSAKVYGNLFKEAGTASQYGRWSLVDTISPTPYLTGGAYTLQHTQAVAPLMNPDIWKDDVITFPLPITVTIYNRDYSNGACDGTPGCKMAELKMVILKDGNIISDRYGSCGVGVNPDTLLVDDNAAKPEIPLGVVANALDSLRDGTNSSIKTLNLLAMLPDDVRMNETLSVEPGFEEYLPYLQFGSNLGDYSVLRVDGTDPFNMYGLCTSALAIGGFCSTVSSFHPGVATWLNGYTFMRTLNLIEQEPTPPEVEELILNMGGLMTSERTPGCAP
ncbi:MAG: hypothetical protein K0Q68_1033 [Moraxellaceae bacterium]|jgi:hypothetical protein|nr:hypothetical protein [Moraxellaceae bacterium]